MRRVPVVAKFRSHNSTERPSRPLRAFGQGFASLTGSPAEPPLSLGPLQTFYPDYALGALKSSGHGGVWDEGGGVVGQAHWWRREDQGWGSGLAEFGLVMQLCHCSPPSLFAPPRHSSSNQISVPAKHEGMLRRDNSDGGAGSSLQLRCAGRQARPRCKSGKLNPRPRALACELLLCSFECEAAQQR